MKKFSTAGTLAELGRPLQYNTSYGTCKFSSRHSVFDTSEGRGVSILIRLLSNICSHVYKLCYV
jgi:hypothetical protein